MVPGGGLVARNDDYDKQCHGIRWYVDKPFFLNGSSNNASGLI